MSALATNGKIKAGGPYAILLSNLGPEFAGSVGILFYLGTTIAATMYSLGGVEAIIANFGDGREQYFPFDKQVIAITWTILLGSIVFAGMKWVAKVATVFLAIVLLSIVFMTIGTVLFAVNAWSPPDIFHAASPLDNMWANYTKDEATGTVPSFTSLIALFFPSVTGIMAGSNRSGVLTNPGRSIPKGTLGAIASTTSIYVFTVWLFGCIVANETLRNNKLVASFIAWPHQYVVAVGIVMSCVGAGLQSLAGAPQLLNSIANEGHIPFLRVFGTDRPGEEPRRAVMFTTAISALVCLAGNLDYITPIITMFFLCMYGAINFACFLSGFLESPSFRPTWKFFHWSTAILGGIVCLVLMFVISVLYAFIALLLVIGIYLYIRSQREKKEWGDALFGLRLEQAMNALIDLSQISYEKRRRKSGVSCYQWWSWICCRFVCCQQGEDEGSKEGKVAYNSGSDLEAQQSHPADETDSIIDLVENDAFMEQSGGLMKERNWRPQILVLCKLRNELNEDDNRHEFAITHPCLLQLAGQLKKGKGLTIVSSVLHGDISDGASKLKCAKAKRFIGKELLGHGVRGFTDVILGSGPNLLEPLRVLLQSKGLGMLSPNTVMLAWPRIWRENSRPVESSCAALGGDCEHEHKKVYVNLLKDAIDCQKALVVVKSVRDLPDTSLPTTSTIDVWWLIHDGDMLVLLPYLLQRHKVWAKSELRIFAIADDLVDFQASHAILQKHLNELRIKAKIEMVHVGATHARDVDQNRTVVEIRKSRSASILSPAMFKPLPPTQEEEEDEEVDLQSPISPTSGGERKRFGDRHVKSPAIKKVKQVLARRRSGSGSKPENPQPFSKQHEVEQIAQHIAKSSGQETQKWIHDKYAARTPRLHTLFAPLGEVGEETTTESEEEATEADVNVAPRVEEHLEDPFLLETKNSRQLRSFLLQQKKNDTPRLKKRLQTARYLNQKIIEHSRSAELVILNLPLSRFTPVDEFVEYTQQLTDGLERVIMLRGHGTEHISTV